MTVIIKDIPGMTDAEVLDALSDISNSPISTGHGGFVVGEEIAYEFLRAFLIMNGYLHQDPPTTVTLGPLTVEEIPEAATIDPPKRRPGRPRKVQP